LRRESRDWRDGLSNVEIGDRAEISKDLRYESKDSREILKGSFSLRTLLWVEFCVEVVDERLKKVFSFAGGDGGR